MNWNFQQILTKDPSSAWGCDSSGNIPPCGVALWRTCSCTEFHRVKNANLRHPSAMWLIARHVQAERTSFAKRVFCQEGVWQPARYAQTLYVLLSAVHKWNHWYFLHKQVYTPECCTKAECCLWINLHYQGHVPRNVVPPVTPVTYFRHSFILLSGCCFLVEFINPFLQCYKLHAHSS